MQEFDNRVVLITGAGTGLGQEIALAFASLGASIAANDINPVSLDETVEKITQAGGNARSYVFDIAKRMPIEGMVAQVLEHFGRIDYLVNHASVQPDAHLLEMDEWEFHRTLDVNLAGPFFAMQQVGRVMQAQGGGAVVNVIYAPTGGVIKKGQSAYLASRAGLVGLTRAAAHDLSPYHIRVNAVVDSRLEIPRMAAPTKDNDQLSTWLASVPEMLLKDHPGMVSRVLFLCSEATRTLTGQIIYDDPGD